MIFCTTWNGQATLVPQMCSPMTSSRENLTTYTWHSLVLPLLSLPINILIAISDQKVSWICHIHIVGIRARQRLSKVWQGTPLLTRQGLSIIHKWGVWWNTFHFPYWKWAAQTTCMKLKTTRDKTAHSITININSLLWRCSVIALSTICDFKIQATRTTPPLPFDFYQQGSKQAHGNTATRTFPSELHTILMLNILPFPHSRWF